MSPNRLALIFMVLGMLLTAPCFATVNVVVSTYDGIVVAADSRVTLQGSGKTRVQSDFGEKVKRVGSHVAVMFSGAAYLYDTEADLRNIGSIIDQYKNNTSISDSSHIDPLSVAKGLESLFTDIYNKCQKVNCERGMLRLLVCGYDTLGERRIYRLSYPDMRPSSIKGRLYDVYCIFDSALATSPPTAFVEGQDDVWKRLILGYDPRLKNYQWFREVDSLVANSLDSTKVDTIKVRVQLNIQELQYDIQCTQMTLQDAIDFSVFIVRATIEAQRFNQASLQGVGGAIDIAVITTDGFKWIQRKQLHGEGSLDLIEH